MNRKSTRYARNDFMELENPSQLPDDLENPLEPGFGPSAKRLHRDEEPILNSQPLSLPNESHDQEAHQNEPLINNVDTIFQKIFAIDPSQLFSYQVGPKSAFSDEDQNIHRKVEEEKNDSEMEISYGKYEDHYDNRTKDQEMFHIADDVDAEFTDWKPLKQEEPARKLEEPPHKFEEPARKLEELVRKAGRLIHKWEEPTHKLEELFHMAKELAHNNLLPDYQKYKKSVSQANLSSYIRGLLKYVSILNHSEIKEADSIIYSVDKLSESSGHFRIRLDVFSKGCHVASIKSPLFTKAMLYHNLDADILQSLTTKKFLSSLFSEDSDPFKRLRKPHNKKSRKNKSNKKKKPGKLKEKTKEDGWKDIIKEDPGAQDVVDFIQRRCESETYDDYFLKGDGYLKNRLKRMEKFNTEFFGEMLAGCKYTLGESDESAFYARIMIYNSLAGINLKYEKETQFSKLLQESLATKFEVDSKNEVEVSKKITEMADLILQDIFFGRDIWRAIHALVERKEIREKIIAKTISRLVANYNRRTNRNNRRKTRQQ